ncbi:MAG: pantetheine-phosphate adenylyltransferase [Myxococcales bacterium]|nr:pantetheine-phosphate adenylyltransferase [Myxococcales bacterium]
MSRIAIYPGSFDPLTCGHVDIIRRGLAIFDQIVIAVAVNIRKQPLFSLDERLAIIEDEFQGHDGVVLDTFSDCLLVDYARRKGAVAILRGLRTSGDFEYELQMTHMNRTLAPTIETVFLAASPQTTHISSSLIKEVARFGGDVSSAVPDHVARRLSARFPS